MGIYNCLDWEGTECVPSDAMISSAYTYTNSSRRSAFPSSWGDWHSLNMHSQWLWTSIRRGPQVCVIPPGVCIWMCELPPRMLNIFIPLKCPLAVTSHCHCSSIRRLTEPLLQIKICTLVFSSSFLFILEKEKSSCWDSDFFLLLLLLLF